MWSIFRVFFLCTFLAFDVILEFCCMRRKRCFAVGIERLFLLAYWLVQVLPTRLLDGVASAKWEGCGGGVECLCALVSVKTRTIPETRCSGRRIHPEVRKIAGPRHSLRIRNTTPDRAYPVTAVRRSVSTRVWSRQRVSG